ncbi:MAG: DUF1016 N-terminal domain-containing protein [Gemmatimonadota bacterium]
MNVLGAPEYDALRQQVSGLLAGGLARARDLVDREKAHTYWEVGRLLNQHIGGRAAYGEQVIPRLATDLGVDRAVLYRMMRFHRRLPNIAAWQSLTWSHCRALITVSDDAALGELLQQSVDAQWTVRQLEARIREVVPARGAAAPPVPVEAPRPVAANLQPRRGQLAAYRLVPALRPDGTEDLALDLGFRVRRPLTELGLGGKQTRRLERAELGPDSVVAAEVDGNELRLRPATVGRERLYAYAATVRRVVDGDTLEVELALGLGVRIVQRVRLRGIDAAERGPEMGQRAQAFVEAQLRGCRPVVVKTFRPDKHDRYLADVFYLAGESRAEVVAERGSFLNGELLRQELAAAYGPGGGER